MLAFHGIFHPVGAGNGIPVGSSFNTASLLGPIDTVRVRFVGPCAYNNSVLYIGFVNTAAAAAVPAYCRTPFASAENGIRNVVHRGRGSKTVIAAVSSSASNKSGC
jgi:hypothetical protein